MSVMVRLIGHILTRSFIADANHDNFAYGQWHRLVTLHLSAHLTSVLLMILKLCFREIKTEILQCTMRSTQCTGMWMFFAKFDALQWIALMRHYTFPVTLYYHILIRFVSFSVS